jgi:hypothetical protein
VQPFAANFEPVETQIEKPCEAIVVISGNYDYARSAEHGAEELVA